MSAEFVSGVFKDMPWHMGGEITGKLLSIPDAIEKSGLGNINVERAPLFVQNGDGEFIKVPDWIAVQDTRDFSVYGVHGSDVYQHKDYADQILPIARAVEQLGHAPEVVDTMGLLRNKRIAFATLAFPEYAADLPDGSPLLPFLNVVSSHDGSYAADYRYSNVRQVCANTVAMSQMSSKGRQRSVRHTTNMDDGIKAAMSHILYIPERVAATCKSAEALLGVKLTDVTVRQILDAVIPIPVLKGDGSNQKGVTMATNRQWDVFSIYQSKPDLQDVKGTAWGLYNAFTDYNDHWARFNNSKNGTAAENRYIRTVLSGDSIADRALSALSELKAGVN